MVTGFGIAHQVHQVDDTVELIRLKGQNPLVVTQRKSRYGISSHIRIITRLHAVLHKDAAALFLVHGVPVIGAHEGIDRDPLLWLLAHDERRQVRLIKLRWTVQSVAYPGHFTNLAQGGLAAKVPKDLLQVREFLGVPPDHKISRIAHSREVIDTAHRHFASLFNVGEELLRLGDDFRSLGAERPRDHLKNCVLGILLNRIEFLVV